MAGDGRPTTSPPLARLIDRFGEVRVLVLGEAILDVYLHGTASRLCREAPVPVVGVEHRAVLPGGAANTAVNVASLGGQVTFLSVLGDDPHGDTLRAALRDRGLGLDHLIVQPGRRTLAKQRVMAAGQVLVRFDEGDTGPIDEWSERRLARSLAALVERHDVVVVSDYAYGIMTRRVVAQLAATQRGTPRILVVDARQLARYRGAEVTAAKPNYSEAVELLGVPAVAGVGRRAEQIARSSRRLLELTGARCVAVTLDSEGALLLRADGEPYRTYAKPRLEVQASGAGDTFTSAFALALGAGGDAQAAVELASAAAAVAVRQEGTAVCSASSLAAALDTDRRKVIGSQAELAAQVALCRQRGDRIVFTNGCFDILHRGHVAYLNRAKALGDVLIVGVNADASVRRLKGPERPVNTLEDRLGVLAAMSCIDHLVAFESDTPDELIRVVRPDVFVKGGDYTRATVPEAALVEQLGGRVQFLPFLEDRSTTALIERIRRSPEAPLAATPDGGPG